MTVAAVALANLLPWRRQRRRERLRFWTGVCVLTLLLIAGPVILGWRERLMDARQLQLLTGSQKQVLQLLDRRIRERELLQQRWSQEERIREVRDAARRQGERWRVLLVDLGARIPSEAWLTAVVKKGDSLTLRGISRELAAVAILEAQLGDLGYRTLIPGPLKRNSDGQWQFSFVMKEAGDVAVD